MIKKLLLVALFLVAGVLAGFYMQGISITGLFGDITASITNRTQPIIDTVTNNIALVGTGLSGVTGAGLLLNKIRSANQAKNALATQAGALQSELTTVETVKLKLTDKVETLEKQASEYQEKVTSQIGTLKAELTEKNDLIEEQRREIERISAEANALSHISEEKIADRVAQLKKDAS